MNSKQLEKIMCIQHCSPENNIFFIDFPSHCPICGVKLQNCELIIPPFCVPCPLLSASRMDLRCCLLIKQTKGDLLRDYQNGDYLHIGITDSNGQVYNYDDRGLCVEQRNWDQCAMIDLECTHSQVWDSILQNSKESNIWTPERYNELHYNCYDYVISMLREINKQQGLSEDPKHLSSKDEFSRNCILPLTTKLAKYIELYRNIKSKGSAVLPNTSGSG